MRAKDQGANAWLQVLNPLPDKKILDWSKLKKIAYNILELGIGTDAIKHNWFDFYFGRHKHLGVRWIKLLFS